MGALVDSLEWQPSPFWEYDNLCAENERLRAHVQELLELASRQARLIQAKDALLDIALRGVGHRDIPSHTRDYMRRLSILASITIKDEPSYAG